MCVGGSVHQTHEAEHRGVSRNTDGRDRFTTRCLIKTLTRAFPLSDASLFQERLSLASVPPPPSRCLAAVLQYSRCYSRCYSQTVCTVCFLCAQLIQVQVGWEPAGGGV